MSNTLYETDFFDWTRKQAALLRTGRLSDADLANIAEEIESMGKSQLKELESRLRVLLCHLLKWQYQSNRRGTSWELTIKEQRRRIERHLKKNPSLKSQIDEIMDDSYGDAVLAAARETALSESVFPELPAYDFDTVMDPGFWPEP